MFGVPWFSQIYFYLNKLLKILICLSLYFSTSNEKNLNLHLNTLSSQGYGFSSVHVWMWKLDCEESWAPKNWCFWTVVLEKTLESPLDCKDIQPVHSKGDQSWVFFGRTDAKAETPILWPPHVKSWLIGKDPDAGRDWRQEEKETTEDEMAGWHHRLDGHEFGWILGVGDGQGGLAFCNLWGCKESNMTEWLNWTESDSKLCMPYFHSLTVQPYGKICLFILSGNNKYST